jgi:hypothetical protein
MNTIHPQTHGHQNTHNQNAIHEITKYTSLQTAQRHKEERHDTQYITLHYFELF